MSGLIIGLLLIVLVCVAVAWYHSHEDQAALIRSYRTEVWSLSETIGHQNRAAKVDRESIVDLRLQVETLKSELDKVRNLKILGDGFESKYNAAARRIRSAIDFLNETI